MFDAFKDRATFNEDISGWDVSNVTNMSHMFNRASSFNQSIGDWNVSSVMSMGYMFRDATSFNSPIGNWNTSSVTNMSLMFEGATSFNQALNDWNISSVSMLNYMFSETTSFNQDIGDWNTSSATLLNYMFKNALSFNQDISDWNIAANASVTGMFDDTPSLSNLNKGQIHKTFSSITNWPNEWSIFVTYEPITDANFQDAVNLWFSDEANATFTYGHIRDWNTSAVTDMSNAFDSRSNFNEDISGWDVSSVENMSMMFKEASSFNKDIGNWDVSSVLSMYRIFRDATLFNQDISNWDVSRVQNLGAAFERASSFNQNISNWNISSVIILDHLFNGASSFNQDIGSWDTSSASSMLNVFRNASSFNQDVSGWNVSQVLSMENMFLNASSFNQNISDWNISSVTKFSFMLEKTALSAVNKGLIHQAFSSDSDWTYDWGIYANASPVDLNASIPLTIAEDQLLGSLVGTFSVVDPDVNASILFDLVDGNGSDSNHEFSLDSNGTLRTAVVFDYEGENLDNDPTLNIRVRATDEYNASIERAFVVFISDVNESDSPRSVDQNETVDQNSSNQNNGSLPIMDQNGSVENPTLPDIIQLADGNKTLVDQNESMLSSGPIVTVERANRPIPHTLNFTIGNDRSYRIRGRILDDGGSSILESGIWISEDISFRGEVSKFLSQGVETSSDFEVLVSGLKLGATYYFRAYARNGVGETLGARKRLKTPDRIDADAWFLDMPRVGGGWRSSDWFGEFQQFSKIEWIYHSQLGWVYAVGDQKEGVWLWQRERGWIWTQRGVWPYLFQNQTSGWLYLFRSINGIPVFYDYSVGSYSTAP